MNALTDRTCPMCGAPTEWESVDVGVGVIYHPNGPYCTCCEWSEYGEIQPTINETADAKRFCPVDQLEIFDAY